LLDVKMPGMDGYEAIRRLKANKNTADIPVVFLTSLNNEEMELKGLSMGAVDYIAKPFSAPLLLKRIEILLLVESQKRELLFFNNNLNQLVEEKTQTVTELKDTILSTMAELVECRDEVTGGHIARTQYYVKTLLRGMKAYGVYEAELADIDEGLAVQSCQLHDVGKIAISDAILLKPDKLATDEFEKIKEHTVFGEKVILQLKARTLDGGFAEYARIFAISHHEKWDGSGYPYGLAGEAIPLLGRIMAIADVYDALVEPRPYKEPYTHDEAVQIILGGRGKHFDPALVDLFEKVHLIFDARRQKKHEI
jgi:putative two-component system response regulator